MTDPPEREIVMELDYQRLILFDVDQTLVNLSGSSGSALDSAFEEVHGIAEASVGMIPPGSLDLPLLKEMYRKWQLMSQESDEMPDLHDVKATYFDHLKKVLDSWTSGYICSGVCPLLSSLASEPNVQLGLQTGNFRESAFIKLRKFGLDTYFKDGGFGGEHMDRTAVVASAIGACQERSGRTYSNSQIFVVGDTPSDIQAGHANEVQTLAVATGHYTADELHMHHPSHLLRDLSDTARVINLLLNPKHEANTTRDRELPH